jgi:ankyrin repeat protein
MNANEQLLEAVDNREVEAVKAALDAGADANAKDSYGIPALHRAMANSDIVKMLLEHGADPDIRDNDGNCALHNDCDEIYHHDRDIASARLLLERGVNVDTRNDSNVTPLIDNCWCGNNSFEFIKFLIENGADVNARSEMNVTALHSAIYEARVDVVELLLEHGAAASAEVESWEYGTPLEFAEREAEEFPDSEESCEVLKKIKEAVEAL